MGTKISHLVPPSRKVETGAGSFEVFPLDAMQIGRLFSLYRAELMFLFEALSGKSPDFSAFLNQFPEIAVTIIAMAARVDDQQEIEALHRLSDVVKLMALVDIWEVTVPDPKKLILLAGRISNLARANEQQSEKTSNSENLPQLNASSTT